MPAEQSTRLDCDDVELASGRSVDQGIIPSQACTVGAP